MKQIHPLSHRVCIFVFTLSFSLYSHSQSGSQLSQEVQFFIDKGLQFQDSGRYDSAIFFIEKALRIFQLSQVSDESLIYGTQLQLGQLYFEKDAYADADSIFLSLLKTMREEGKRDSIYAEALHAVGMLRYNESKYTESQEYLDQSLALKREIYSEWHASMANSYNALGNLVSDMGDFELARTYYEKTLEIRKKIFPEDHPHISDTYQNLGILSYSEGDYETAIRFIEKGLEMEKRIYPTEHPILASSYNNLGVMYDVMGNGNRALEYYSQSLAIRKKLLGEKHSMVGQSYHNMGVVHQEFGDLSQAVANYTKSLYIFQEHFGGPYHEEIGTIYENMGNAMFSLKNFRESQLYLEKSLNIYREIFPTDNPSIGKNLQSLGEVHAELSEFETAHRYLNQAESIYKGVRPDFHLLASLNKVRGELALFEKKPFEAKQFFRQALEIKKKNSSSLSPDIPVYLNEEAGANIWLKDTIAARNSYLKALKANLPDFPQEETEIIPAREWVPLSIPSYLRTLEELAAIYALDYHQSGQKAADLWDLALYWLNQAQTRSSYRDSKLLFRRRARNVCEAAVKNQLKLFHHSQDPNHLEKAFELAEYSQTVLLHEWIKEIEAQEQAGVPQSLLDQVQDLSATASYYEKKLYELGQNEEKDEEMYLRYQSRLVDVRNSHDSLVQALEISYPAYYQMKYETKRWEVEKMQQELKSNEQVIRFFLTEENLYTFSLTQEGLTHFVTPWDSTATREAYNFYEFIRQNPSQVIQNEEVVTEYVRSAHNLYSLFLEPILKQSTEKLYIIPEGILSYIPFEALLYEEVAEFESYSLLPYVVKKLEITYSYSSQLLFDSPFSENSASFMGFAPEYGTQSFVQTSTRKIDSIDLDLLPRLFYNQTEVEALQKLMQGKAYLGPEAREEAFKLKAPEASILHLAMHAITNDINPLYSGLAFTKVDTSFENNFLYTYELFNMRLKADLAVLSACNTGSGTIQRGEGLLSLAKGFQYAGCPNLIMSLWQTDDRAAYQLMLDFYSHLREGHSYSGALQQAKLTYLETQDRTHPFYWATFLYLGQRSSGTPLPEFWWILGVLVAMIAISVILWKRG